MATWIALLRGINVGGRHKLPMAQLRGELERAGFSAVRTYIQSGNVVFECARGTADSIAQRLCKLVEARFGFAPKILVLGAREFEKAAAANPFPAADAAPKSLHLFFLAAVPRAVDVESLQALKSGAEDFALRGKVLYLFTPDGFGTSRLAERLERQLRVEATARNWRTVGQLIELANC
jgi:uncharacterized protein (DUF1697 family)